MIISTNEVCILELGSTGVIYLMKWNELGGRGRGRNTVPVLKELL